MISVMRKHYYLTNTEHQDEAQLLGYSFNVHENGTVTVKTEYTCDEYQNEWGEVIEMTKNEALNFWKKLTAGGWFASQPEVDQAISELLSDH
jgi:hypothetical protein